jgi:hypothetical protein
MNHLEDIAPSKRDANWSGLAERACSSYLGSIKLDEQSGEQAILLADRILQRYPALKQSKVFMAKRAAVGLDAFGWTYSHYRHASGDDEWIDKMKEFVKSDAQTPDIAQRAAKKVQKYLVAYCAWPFWKMAIDRGANVCKDPDFQKSIMAALDGALWKAETGDVAQNKCWGDLKTQVMAEFDKEKADKFRKTVCELPKVKSALSAAQAAKCKTED